MDILILLLLFVAFWNAKSVKPFSKINDDYLSMKTSNSFRGLLSIIIIFHHLSQMTEDGKSFRGFNFVGFLAVAMFFFYSGYGLQRKYMLDKNYSKGFLCKRIPKILIPYVLVNFIYWYFNLLIGNDYTFTGVLKTIFDGYPMAYYSWYVISILYFYLAFYILMLICNKNHKLVVFGSVIALILWVCICKNLSWGEWYYNSSSAFVVGILFSTYEEQLVRLFKKYYFLILTLSLSIFGIGMFLVVAKWYSKYPNLDCVPSWIISFITSIPFTFIIILILQKIKFGNPILKFLGNISFEIYLIHGLFVLLGRNDKFFIDNDLLYSLFVLTCSIISAWILHMLFSIILKGCSKILNCKSRQKKLN